MKWKAAGAYAIISECGHYTISQCKIKDGWAFRGYFKSKTMVAREDCEDSYNERKVAAAKVKQACARHAGEK